MSNLLKLVKHTGIYAIGKVSGQLVGFLMLPIYTRYLEPSDYGIISLLTVVVLLVGRLFGARLVAAVPRFYYQEQGANGNPNAVVSTALSVTVVVSLISTIVLIIFREELAAAIFGSAVHGFVLAIFSITLVTAAIEHYALIFIRLQDKPYLFVSVNLGKLAVQLGLNIWLVVFLDLKVLGVAISAAASSVIFALALLLYTVYNTGMRFDRGLAVKMIRFTWPLWVSSIAAIYIWSSSRFYLRYFESLDDVGLFELAAKFASVLMLVCWEPFFQYWQTERFKLYQKEDARPVFKSVFYFITTILVMVGLGISIFSDPAIRIMATENYHGAIVIVPLLVLANIFYALVEFSNFGCLVKDRTDLLANATYTIAVFATVVYLMAIPLLGIYGAAIALVLIQIANLLLTEGLSRKQYDSRISLKPLAMLVTFAIFWYCISNIWLKQDDILIDIALKLLIYLLASASFILVLIRDPEQRERVNGIVSAVIDRFNHRNEESKS